MEDYGLKDVWRLHNPDSKEYTYYSSHHKSYSRIGMFFTNNSITHKILNPSIDSITISGNAPITLTYMAESFVTGRSRWRFNTSLLKDDFFQ